MRNIFLIILGFILFLTGCGEPTGQTTYHSGGIYDAFGEQGSTAAFAKGRFTISLAIYEQMDQEQQANQLLSRARQLLNNDEVWIETFPKGLSVNYGHFATMDKAKRHLPKIKSIYATLQPGNYQFFYAKEIPEPDPDAPSEWNIVNTDCYYSLKIAAYYNVPESNYYNRKQDAVQAVKNLRQEGTSAYYYHGYYESLVLIGCMYQNVPTPIVEILRKKFPWHYENSYRVYNIKEDSQHQKHRLQKKSYLVAIDDILESP